MRCYVILRAILAPERQNDADGLFRGRPVDANSGDETSDQFVHLPLASPALAAG
jgi:hypothetical protein